MTLLQIDALRGAFARSVGRDRIELARQPGDEICQLMLSQRAPTDADSRVRTNPEIARRAIANIANGRAQLLILRASAIFGFSFTACL